MSRIRAVTHRVLPLFLISLIVASLTPTAVPQSPTQPATPSLTTDGPLPFSHAWIVVSTGAPERAALETAGFRIAPNVNHHDGQGTSSISVEFLNGFFELIYPDPAVPVSPSLQAGAEKFRLKAAWRDSGYSPIGVVFDRTSTTPEQFPFSTWKISADWMDKGTFIEMLTPKEMPKAVSLSISSHRQNTASVQQRMANDPKTAAMFLHPNGTRRLTEVRVVISPSPDSLPPAVFYLAQHTPLKFEIGPQWLLDMTLDGGKRGIVKDLRPGLPVTFRY